MYVTLAPRRVDPISLSQTLWALAKLRHTPTQDWFAAYYQAARGSLGQLTPQGLSNMIWAAAALQVGEVRRVQPGHFCCGIICGRADEGD
jgi:hypothetical protein